MCLIKLLQLKCLFHLNRGFYVVITKPNDARALSFDKFSPLRSLCPSNPCPSQWQLVWE
uniref:Uncharacterized protein n=1 Tax=Rhizophora mucronata TaxID=61149 RepID=A0A2P2QUP7_RHIMU